MATDGTRRRRLTVIVGVVAVVAAGFAVGLGLVGTRHATDVVLRPSTTSTTGPSTTATTVATTTTPTSLPVPGTNLPHVPLPGEPVAASTPEGMAQQIATAEAAVDDPTTPETTLARQAHTEQVVFRTLVNRPDLQAATYAALTDRLRPIARANVEAGADLRALLPAPKTSLPNWHVVAPAPAAELLADYKEAEAAVGIPWQYLAAVHLVETRLGRIRGASDAGAQGPMQFLPSTFAQYGNGGDINSNHDAILAAARYLKRNGAPADMRNALFNYNRDHRYGDAVILYAERMKADPRAFSGYYYWQVYYVTVAGDVWLPEGYGQ